MPAPDLTRPIAFRGTLLNDVAISQVEGRPVLRGCRVDYMDVSDVDIVQFREKLALSDGMDVGGVWLGARRIVIRGTVFDKTRGETYDRIASLETLFLPKAINSTTQVFGFYDLSFYTVTGAGDAATLQTISAQPQGLRYAIERPAHGRNDFDNAWDPPLAIAWQVSLYAKNPAMVVGGFL